MGQQTDLRGVVGTHDRQRDAWPLRIPRAGTVAGLRTPAPAVPSAGRTLATSASTSGPCELRSSASNSTKVRPPRSGPRSRPPRRRADQRDRPGRKMHHRCQARRQLQPISLRTPKITGPRPDRGQCPPRWDCFNRAGVGRCRTAGADRRRSPSSPKAPRHADHVADDGSPTAWLRFMTVTHIARVILLTAPRRR